MKKTTLIKTLIFLGLFTFCCFSPAFAINGAAKETLQEATLMLNLILSILSWAWIPFAYIAGNLLTNSRVYGEILGIDSFLRICRNMIKNISNFLLWFLFLFYLFRTLIFKTTPENMMKGIVVKILVAGVAIQSSRFLTAATLDISTIATAAVGAIPSQIIGGSDDLYGKFKKAPFLQELGLTAEKKKTENTLQITVFPSDGNNKQIYAKKDYVKATGIPEENLIDSLLPNQNHLAGPLIYIGMGILQINQDITFDIEHPISALTKLILSGLETIVYSIAMFFLCIIAFMRILYLWLFIILSPLIVLLFCLEHIGTSEKIDTKKLTDGIMKGLDIKGFINLAFKPVIITFGISIALLLSVFLKNAVDTKQHSFEMWPGTTIESKEHKTETTPGIPNVTYDTSIETENISIILKEANKSFLDMLIGIIVLVLIRFIVKLALTSKTGIEGIDKFTENRTKKVEDVGGLAKNIPIIPGTGLSYNTVAGNDNMFQKMKNAQITEMNETTKKQIKSIANPILKAWWMWGMVSALDSSDSHQLHTSINPDRPRYFINKAKEISIENEEKEIEAKRLSFKDQIRIEKFSEWMDKTIKNTENPFNKRQTDWDSTINNKDKNQRLETFFNSNEKIKTYRNEFWREGIPQPNGWNELKNSLNSN